MYLRYLPCAVGAYNTKHIAMKLTQDKSPRARHTSSAYESSEKAQAREGTIMRWHQYLLLGLIVFLPRFLCAGKFPEYPAKGAKEYPGAQTTAGVTIGIEPLPDTAAQKQYFKMDFAKKNLLPVFLVVENASSGDRFIVKQNDIGIYAGEEQLSGSGQVASGRSKTGETIAPVVELGMSLPGMVVAGFLMARAADIRQNVIKKEFRSSTLSPGQKDQGFVYLPLPADPEKRKHLRMRVRVMKVGSEEPIDFEFPI
jgi:hypothetical protein